jgi:hypothetical protein
VATKYRYRRKKNLPHTIRRIPDKVLDEVKNILPKEKPRNIKGHPAPIPFRQEVLDDILLFVLITAGCQWKKMLPKERIWFWLYLSQKVPAMG